MFDENASALKQIEFLRVDRKYYVAEIGMVDNELIFHFYQKVNISWPHNKIDELFKSVFQGDIKDLTGEFEHKMKDVIKRKKAGEKIPTSFMLDIYNEVRSTPEKIQRTFTTMTNSWTYTIKDIVTPFVDLLAKKIIEGLDELITPI